MATPLGLDINELPPELQIEAMSALRRQKVAEAMSARGMEPVQPVQGKGAFAPRIHPMQGVAQIANAVWGAQGQRDADTQMAGVGAAYNKQLADGVQSYLAKSRLQSTTPSEAAQDPGFGATERPNPRAIVEEGLTSRNPLVQKLAGAQWGHLNELDKPYTLNQGDKRVYPTGERPDVLNPLDTKKAIPADWEKHLPPGAKREKTDPAGVFRMAGGDGQHDVYSMEFEAGKPVGYKRLDNSPLDPLSRAAGRGVQQATIQHPLDPTKTLVVNSNTFDAEKFKKGDRTGVIGDGPKSSQEGVQRAEGFATLNGVKASFDKLEKQVDVVLKSKLGRITGLLGAAPNIPGSEGANAQERLNTLKTQVGFETLQALRNAAHSGASGLGQVTEKEHVYLQQQLGSLEKAQSEAEIRRVLTNIKTWLGEARTRVQENYEKRYAAGGPPPGATLTFDAQGNLVP